jgi:DNA-binding CsgD family transcriptional regulator
MHHPERAEPPTPALPALSRAVEIAEAIGSLPAVPTIDWCDRAAACMARLFRSGVALVAVVTADEAGRVLALEAAGVAHGQPGPDRTRTAARAQPRLVREQPVEEVMLDAIRARAERVSHIGWTPDSLSQPAAGLLGSMPMARAWRTGAIGRLWGDLAPAELLVGLAPLGEHEHGRMLMVQVAPLPPVIAEAEDAAVLRALIPLLSRRALMALGAVRSHLGQWLTAREQAVLDRLVIGRSVKQIAEELGRSTHTIHDHVKSLHRKLSASSRGELIARALGCLGADPHRPARQAQPAQQDRPPLNPPIARSA